LTCRFTGDAIRLSDRELREPTLERRVKSQDDIALWHPFGHQPVGDAFLRSVVLDPDLAVLDVHMKQAAVDTPLTIPTHGHQLIMTLDRIDDRLDLNLTVGRLAIAVLSQDILY
jgi:hypothetical protein